MSAKYTFLTWELEDEIKAGALVVLLQLANNANDDGISWYSIDKMAPRCKMSVRAFKANLKVLTDKGLVSVERRPNKTSIYRLTLGSAKSALPDNECKNDTPEVQNLHHGSAESAHDPNNEPNNDLINKKINKKSSVPKKYSDLDFSPLGFNESELLEFIQLRENKRAGITERVIKNISRELEIARTAGFTNDQVLNVWSERGWASFKAEWLRNAVQSFGRDNQNHRNNFESKHDPLGGFNRVN